MGSLTPHLFACTRRTNARFVTSPVHAQFTRASTCRHYVGAELGAGAALFARSGTDIVAARQFRKASADCAEGAAVSHGS